MPSRVARTRILAVLGVALLPAASTTPGNGAAPQTAITDLAGRWAGAGTVRWKNGNEQPYKCIVTYFLGDNATRVKQTMRCSSADDVKLEIATLLQVSGETITGTWEDRSGSLNGTITGKVRPNGYEALAQHRLFNAAFEIEMPTACEQQVTIRPSREISVITANLRKC